MKEYKIENHESSRLPDGKNWKLVWSDEFDGTELDCDKWLFREYFWGKKSPTWTKEGVTVSDGALHIALVKKGEDYYSAHLQTGGMTFDIPKDTQKFWPFGARVNPTFMHKFGYYECRCKLPKNDGWHAAFWLQAPGIGTHPDPKYCGVECDIMENYLHPTTGDVICGNGWGGYGSQSKWGGHFHFKVDNATEEWHTYAVDWSREGYIFYCDGKEVGRQMAPECAVSEVTQFICLSTECHGYHRAFPNERAEASAAGDALLWGLKPVRSLTKAVLPDEFVVDYVRVFDAIE